MLVRDGELVRAQRKTLELLAALLAASGNAVPSERLRETLWPDGAVEDRNLSQHAYLLRQILSADPRVVVETVPRRGYRLVVPAVVAPVVQAPVLPHAPSLRAGGKFARFNLARTFALGICAIVLATTAGFAAHPAPRPLTAQSQRSLQLGWLQWERRNARGLDVAERYFEGVRATAPDDARAYAGLAAVAVIRGDEANGKKKMHRFFGDATVLARASLARDPRNADAYDVLGLVAELRDHDAAQSDTLFRHAQMLDGQNAYAHIWRGIELYDSGLLENALAELDAGELLAPASKTAARWLGLAQYERHAFGAAADQFRTVLEIDPDDAEAHMFDAQLDEALGNYPSAIRKMQYRAIPPEKRIPAIARLEALTGRIDLARRELAGLPKNASVDYAELAAAKLAVGDTKGALKTLARLPAEDRLETGHELEWDVRYAALRRAAQLANVN